MSQFLDRIQPNNRYSLLLAIAGCVILGVLLGLVATSGVGQLLLPTIGIVAVLLLPILAQRQNKIYYMLLVTITSSAVAREALNLPLETDLIVVIVLAGLIWLSHRGLLLRPGIFRVPIWPLALYLGLNLAVAVIASPVPLDSLRQTAALIFRAVTFFAVILAVRAYPERRFNYPRLFAAIVCIEVLISVIAVVLQPYFPLPFVQFRLNAAISIRGTFQEANLMAIFILCALTLLTAMQMYRGRRRIGVFSIYLIVGLIGLLLAQTRSVWIGFIVIFVLMSVIILFESNRRIGLTFFFYGMGLTAMGAIVLPLLYIYNSSTNSPVVISSVVNRLSNIVTTNSSVIGRLRTWRIAFQSIREHPWFGSGLLSYNGPTFNTSGEESAWLYNFFIQSLHDSGIIGTVLITIFYAIILSQIWRAFRQAQRPGDRGAMMGYGLAIVALLFTSLFSSFVWSAFAWILMGLAVGHSLIILDGLQADEDPAAATVP